MPTERNIANSEFDAMQQETACLMMPEQPETPASDVDDLPPAETPAQPQQTPAAKQEAAEAPAREAAAAAGTKSKYEEKPLSEKELEFLKKFPWETIKDYTGLTYETIMRSYNSDSVFKKWTPDACRRLMNGNYVQTTVRNPLGDKKDAYISIAIRKDPAAEGYILRDLHIVDIPCVVPKVDADGKEVSFVASNGERKFVTVPGQVDIKPNTMFTLYGDNLNLDMSEGLRLTGAAGTYYNKTEHYVLMKGKSEGSSWWAPISELEFRKRLNGGAKSIETSEADFPKPSDHEIGTIRRHTTKYCVGLTPGGQVVRRPVSKIDSFFDRVIAATEAKGGPRAYNFIEHETGESFLINKDQTMELARGKVLTLTNKKGYTVCVRYDVLQGKVVRSTTFDAAKRLERERSLVANREQHRSAAEGQSRPVTRTAPKM